MQPLHHDPEYGRGIRFTRCRSYSACSPVSSPKRSRTFVSALSERRPEPLDDRAVICVIDPCGIRTQPLQLERLATSPEVERAVLCAHRVRKVGREVLESSSADFQSAANPSQLPTHDRGRHRGQNEKARCRGDTGLRRFSPNTAKHHKRRIWVESSVTLLERAD